MSPAPSAPPEPRETVVVETMRFGSVVIDGRVVGSVRVPGIHAVNEVHAPHPIAEEITRVGDIVIDGHVVGTVNVRGVYVVSEKVPPTYESAMIQK